MKLLRRILSVAGWVLAGAVVLVVGVYLTALAVNRHDRPPSSEVERFAAMLEARPGVADEDNAYVYMLGLAAPRGADPMRIGVERAAWIRRLRTDFELSRDSDPYSADLGDVWMPESAELFTECSNLAGRDASRRDECFRTLSDAGPGLEAWLAEQAWVLERYETLLGFSSWREITTLDHRGPYSDITKATYARRVWFLEAWARANGRDVPGVREALGADLEFWRDVLAGADTLLSKMVATGMIRNHFEQSTAIFRSLPPELVAGAVPASWREPISASERSLRRAFAYELANVRSYLDDLAAGSDRYSAWAGVDVEQEPESFMQRLDDSLADRLFQQQDFVNKRAHRFALIADTLDEPYERIPGALERASAAAAPRAWHEPLYNVVGDMLRAQAAEAYDNYARRISDLEGVRRAAVLAAELRARGVAPEAVAAALENAELTNPYTEQPFVWDGESSAIVFDGLGPRYNGRYELWY